MREEYRTESDTSVFLYGPKGKEDSSASMGGGPLTTSVAAIQKRGFTIYKALVIMLIIMI